MRRREFLKTAALSTAALALPHTKAGTMNAAKLPQRPYGSTGVQLSIIGFGGIVVTNVAPEDASRLVAEAIEKGVNYFDVAPSYGNAEERLGPALEPYRKDVFLACKTGQRTAEGAAAELKQSLERLRTDSFDLYQLHAISDVAKDVDAVFAKGGAMEVFLEAKKQGQVRYLGFSAHSVEAAFAAMDRYDFDSILFPVNFTNYHKGSFGYQIMDKAVEKGVARLALKAMARQQWPEGDSTRPKYSKCWYQPLTDPREADLGIRFTLSQPVTAAIPPGEESLFRMAVDIAMNYRPLTLEELDETKALALSLNPIFQATA